jgi:cytochrome o ubiquinol oxidase subunit 1
MSLLGNSIWSAIPLDQPIIMGASVVTVVGIVAILAWITRTEK